MRLSILALGLLLSISVSAPQPRAAAGVLATYVFASDEHVDLDPTLGPVHKAISMQVYDAARSLAVKYLILGGDEVDSSTVAEWDSLAAWIGPELLAKVLQTAGNHEGFSPGGLARYSAFAGSPGWSSYGYAFCVDDAAAGVRIVIGYSGYVERGNLQYFAWLEAMFATKPDKYFLIYVQHSPPYSGAERGAPQLAAFDHLVPLFEQYKGDVFLAGHGHARGAYRPWEEGPYYFVWGGAGMELEPITRFYPGMVVNEQDVRHGYYEIEVGLTSMTVRAVTVASASGPAGQVLGEYTIDRRCPEIPGVDPDPLCYYYVSTRPSTWGAIKTRFLGK